MPKQALLNGTLEDANDFNDYNELNILREALEMNSWSISEIRTERAGYNFIRIVNGNKELTLHIYLKKVSWRNRNVREKATQFPANHVTTGYEVRQTINEKTVMLGIYKRNTFDDYLICGWEPSEWGNRGRAFNCFIDTIALAEGFRIGFANDHTKNPRKVFAFRPEFIHYYLINRDILHGTQENRIEDLARANEYPHNRIYFGAPGTGKSNAILNYTNDNNSIKVTFHPDTDYASFVGTYKPVQVEEEDRITYDFAAQAFLKAYTKAWETEEDIYLIIEEINRGNCAQIFGDIFQIIERAEDGFSKYPIDVDADIKKYLKKHYHKLRDSEGEDAEKATRYFDYFNDSFDKIKLPPNLYIHATMNTSDQSLFPIDSAFKRRWDWEYVPIKFEGTEANHYLIKIGDKDYSWRKFVEEVNKKIEILTESEDKKLGPFFVKSYNGSILERVFKAKVMFYLWNDILKDEPKIDENFFFRKKMTDNDTSGTPFSFNELFAEDSSVILKKFMNYLEIEEE